MTTNKTTISRDQLVNYLDEQLQVSKCRDYCPNGLQVEGRHTIAKIVTGVTASAALLDAAIQAGADAILVHHGYFWRGEDSRIVGFKYQRLRKLIQHEVNLLAYHLPLDMHAEWGNNISLARQLGIQPDGRFGENDLGWLGKVSDPGIQTLAEFAAHVERVLQRKPTLIGDPSARLGRLGWCTGAAQSMMEAAVLAGAQVYLSGEISEPTVHLARETGVAYLACGHHASERYGVQALGQHLASVFGIAHEFIEIDNPV